MMSEGRATPTAGGSILRFSIDITIEPDEDQFHAYAPALEGLHVGGRTEEEALQNAIDATYLYLEGMIRHGDPIPLGIIKQDESPRNGHSGVHHHTRNVELSFA